MNVRKYVFVQYAGAELAASMARRDLEDTAAAFYDGFEVDESGVIRVKDFSPTERAKAAAGAEQAGEALKDAMERYEIDGDTSMLGLMHIRYGEMLREELCERMPYFNLAFWDWTVPEDNDDGAPWFAVPVTFF